MEKLKKEILKMDRIVPYSYLDTSRSRSRPGDVRGLVASILGEGKSRGHEDHSKTRINKSKLKDSFNRCIRDII